MSRSIFLNSQRKDLLDIYKYAIEAIKPDNLVRSSISVHNNTLSIGQSKTDCDKQFNVQLTNTNVHVIGIGKSAIGMACGLSELATHSKISSVFSHGKLSVPIGLKSSLDHSTKNKLNSINVECCFGSQDNLPDNHSVEATRKILKSIDAACEDDRISSKKPLFIVLISGGGSACLSSPKYIELSEKLDMIKFLVQHGADIVELNKVRRYFSRVKGGQLAAHILRAHPKAQVLSLIMSDVIGDPIEFIASGPTFIPDYFNQNHFRKDAFDVLNKYNYRNLDSKNIAHNKPSDQVEKGRIVINSIVGNNKLALQACKDRASALGYIVKCLGDNLSGETDVIVQQLCNKAHELNNEENRKVLIIGGGEATVSKQDGESWGLGGRAQEMALDYMIFKILHKSPRGEPIDYFLAGGTDGQDGPTDVAACLASQNEWECDNEKGVCSFTLQDLQQAKAHHNSNSFWTKAKPDWLIKTGLTGTNVMDLYMYSLSNR